MPAMFAQLVKDHRRLSGLFEELEQLWEAGRKEELASLFEQLALELETHTQVEERILYPRLMREDATHALTLEAEEEHKLVKQLLDELGSERRHDDRWFAKLKVLKDLVEHHVGEEERELFPKAESVIAEDEEGELLETLVAQRDRLMRAGESGIAR